MRVLTLAAHHDDETLGCGATIARLAAEGHEVRVLVLGEGPRARGGLADKFRDTVQHSRNALKHLGATLFGIPSQWEDYGLPDNQFDTIPLLTIAKHIENMVLAFRPDVVYTQHGGDLNRDHQLTYHATLIATRPLMGAPVKEVYAYEVPSSTEWAFGSFAPPFQPNTFVDISGEYLDKKIAAMEMYETERRPFPHPRSPEALRALAMWRGAQSGCMAAEAFQLVRCIR